MMLFLTAAAFIAICYFVVLIVKFPHIRKMAWRRIGQNKASTFWTIVGSSIAISMIASSLLLHHSVSSSVDSVIEERLGNIIADVPSEIQTDLPDGYFYEDQVKSMRSIQSQQEAAVLLPIVGWEGTLFRKDENGTAVNQLPSAYIFGFSFEEAKEFAAVAAELLPDKLEDNEVILSKHAAAELKASAGDTIYYSNGTNNAKLKVASVVPEKGLTGYRGFRNAQAAAIVNMNTARQWGEVPEAAYTNILLGASRPLDHNESSFYVVAGDWKVVHVYSRLENALSGSTKLLPIFTIASLTALATSLALIFNVFKMIAVERKQEFGILRAMGMTRSDLKVLIRAEGFFYACFAGAAGTGLGAGIAYVLMLRLRDVLGNIIALEEGIAVNYRFFPNIGILFGSFSFGILLIGMAIMLLTIRFGSVPIVEALKPDAQKSVHPKRSKVHSLIGLFILILTGWVFGLTRLTGFQEYLSGKSDIFPLIVFGVAFLLVVLMICTIVVLLEWFVKLLLLIVKPFSAIYLALQMAFRYPLVQRVRTGLIIAMFALVMFLTSFSAIFGETMTGFFGKFDARTATGGFDLVTTLPEKLTTDELNILIDSDEENKAYMEHAIAMQGFEMPDIYNMRVHGVNEEFVRSTALPLEDYDSAFPNERTAWEALLSNNDYVIISDLVLKYSGVDISVGDKYEVNVTMPIDYGSPPETVEKTVIGIAKVEDESHSYSSARGIWTSMESLEAMSEHHVTLDTSVLIRVPKGIEISKAKEILDKTLASHNLSGLENPKERYEAGTAFMRSFFTVFEGFSAVAIMIGLAGLLMIMLRVVKERRQFIGVLRSIGVSSKNIYTSIWTEGLFLGLTGTLIGLFTGTYSGILMIEALFNSDEGTIAIQFPYLKLIIYLLAACVLSALVSSAAARQAMKLSPAEATKYVS